MSLQASGISNGMHPITGSPSKIDRPLSPPIAVRSNSDYAVPTAALNNSRPPIHQPPPTQYELLPRRQALPLKAAFFQPTPSPPLYMPSPIASDKGRSSENEPPPYHLLYDLEKLKATELTNAMVHLYRGEMSRQIAYRIRLDTSTNWAVTITAALTVFSLGNDKIPHYFHVVVCVFVAIFLVLESRRYGYYIAVKKRVRQLETGFYGRVLLGDSFGKMLCGLKPLQEQQPQEQQQEQLQMADGAAGPENSAPVEIHPQQDKDTETIVNLPPISNGEVESREAGTKLNSEQQPQQYESEQPFSNTVQPYLNDWTHLLYNSLFQPSVSMRLADAIFIRLYRVYLLLFLGVLASWIIKVHLVQGLITWDSACVVLPVVGLYIILSIAVWWYLPKKHSSRLSKQLNRIQQAQAETAKKQQQLFVQQQQALQEQRKEAEEAQADAPLLKSSDNLKETQELKRRKSRTSSESNPPVPYITTQLHSRSSTPQTSPISTGSQGVAAYPQVHHLSYLQPPALKQQVVKSSPPKSAGFPLRTSVTHPSLLMHFPRNDRYEPHNQQHIMSMEELRHFQNLNESNLNLKNDL